MVRTANERQTHTGGDAISSLNDLSSHLWRARSLDEGLREVLSASLALLRADMGIVQLRDAETGALSNAAQRGFGAESLAVFTAAGADGDAPGLRALRAGERVVIEDIETDPAGAALRPAARLCGFRALLCTPLLGHDGTALGVLSVHFRSPHRPTEHELQHLDLYARQACDFITRCRSDELLRKSESMHRLLSDIGMLGISDGAGGGLTVSDLIRAGMQRIAETLAISRCGLSRVDLNARRIIVEEDVYTQGESLKGAFALGAHEQHMIEDAMAGRLTVITDVATDPRTAAHYESVYRAVGIRACVNVPLHRAGRWQANFWISADKPRRWTDQEIRFLRTIAGRFWLIVEQARVTAALSESEQRFRTMADSAPVMIWIAGLDKGCTWFNKPWLEFVGRSIEQEQGNGWAENVHPDDYARCLATYVESFDARRPFSMEYRLKNREGIYRWVLDDGIPLIGPGQAFTGYIGSCIDITERKHAEEALRASEERYRTVVDSQSEMVCRFQPDGTILFVNQAYALSRSTTPEALIGRNFWEFVPAADRPAVQAMLAQLTPAAPEQRVENRFVTSEGERWTLWNNRALRFTADGRLLEAQSAGIDITDRKLAEQALATNARRVDALYSMSHRLQRASSLPQVYEASLDAIVAAIGCKRASILLFDRAGVMRFVAWRGLSEGYRRAVEGHSPWRADEKDAHPIGVADIEADDMPAALKATIRAEGVRALGFIPLISEGRLIGKFMTYYDVPHTFSDDELEIALTIGNQTAFAVERWRAESERLLAQEQLRIHVRQQEAIAKLGELALRERDLQRVFEHATATVAQTLDVECCEVLECRPGGDEMLLRAGVGWSEALIGNAMVSASADTLTGFTLQSDAPVIAADLQNETRFRGPPLLFEHAVASAMSCVIRGTAREPWGMLGAHARRSMEFTQDDANFLVSVANILGDAIRRDRTEQALQEADRRKDEFLATLSHELRNPLAPLRNSLQVLKLTGAVDATSTPLHDIMERQVSHLVRLVDDLLEMSRISRGALELRKERVELAIVVRNALETSDPLIRDAGHSLETRLPEEPLWFDGDPVRLAQVLSNLLNNAAKYTAPGGSISVVARREGNNAAISVRDNGSGIDPAELGRIFEMFSRGYRPREPGGSSLGIGLPLARRLAEMHGGTIDARSAGRGHGSEFTLRLPLAADPLVAASAGNAVQTGGLPGRILVVDDNHDAADSLAMLLETLGAEVRVAHGGAEALEVFAEYAPAVVLLDIGMPGMNGYEVARELRKRFPAQRAALIALTGWGQQEDKRRARDAGFDHHLIKPADMETLQRLLASL